MITLLQTQPTNGDTEIQYLCERHWGTCFVSYLTLHKVSHGLKDNTNGNGCLCADDVVSKEVVPIDQLRAIYEIKES